MDNSTKRRGCAAREINFLPEEIISDILVRLPANELVRFKPVCKLWRSLISHPSFLNSHLSRSRSQSQIILTTFSKSPKYQFGPPIFHHCCSENQPSGYYDPDVNILSLNLKHSIRDMIGDNIIRFKSPRLVFSIKASCDGLFLIRDQHKRLFLRNPAVNGTCKHLPDLVEHSDVCPRGLYDFIRDFDWTLFYDTTAGKYKVCLFRYHKTIYCRFLLLTVGEDRWSQCSYPCHLKPISPLVYLDKKLHWLTFDNRSSYHHSKQCFIISLDLAEIKTRTTDVPLQQDGDGQHHLLSVVKGCLCLTSFSADQLDIFFAQDFAAGLWTKQYTTSLSSLSNLPASLKSFLSDDICVVVSKHLSGSDFSSLVKIFIHHENQLICYDLKHQQAKITGRLSKDQRLRESYMFYSATFVRP